MRRFVPLSLLALFVCMGSASAQIVPRGGGPPIAVESHRVEAIVEDGLARTTVRQTFVNHGARALEAIYTFPLPEGAALLDVAMEVGGQRLEGLLAERQRARKVYDDIVRTRRDPALVEQIGRDTFRLSVFPVVPEMETVVEISWIQQVPLTDGVFRYVFPLTLGGRATKTERDFSATVRMRSAVAFTDVQASRSDVQLVRVSPFEVLASLEESGATLDRDLVVTGRIATPTASLAVKTFRDASGADGWFQAVITPPPVREDELLPRDVILVIDTSGSMGSDGKMEQAKTSARWLLDHLRPTDRVNVIRFSSDVVAFAPAPVAATPDNLAKLAGFVQGLSPLGSTALGDAVLAAATQDAGGPGRAHTIVLLTDGLPTVGEMRPAKLMEFAKAGAKNGLRLFPFGVGPDVDAGLLRGMAAAGEGRAEVFRPGGEIVTRLTSFLARTSSPVLGDLVLFVDGVDVYDVFPRPLPNAYLGEQVTITGRYRGAGRGTVSIAATRRGRPTAMTATTDFGAAAHGSPSVAHLFAQRKLAFLEEARRLRLGLGDDAYYAALDRGAYSTADEIVQEMIAVSLGHGVQCAYTSFLVLLPEDRHRLDPRDTQAVTAALTRAREQMERTARSSPSIPGVSDELEEPVEMIEAEIEEEPLEEPILLDAEGSASDFLNDSPFDSDAFNDVIGVGGGVGGKFGGRFGGRKNLGAKGGAGTERSLHDGLEWLRKHQDPDGKWDADQFMKRDPADAMCDGAGRGMSNEAVTAMALLAFLGEGNTLNHGRYKDVVAGGVVWLKGQHDPASGLFGDPAHPGPLRDHAMATTAMCEAYYFSKSPLLKRPAQTAINYLVGARDADAGWSGGKTADGRPGPEATGWVISALITAKDAGLVVDEAALAAALDWATNVRPAEGATAVAMALYGRFLLGQDPADHPDMLELADFLPAQLPAADAPSPVLDPDFLHFATYALYQTGGPRWQQWNTALKNLVLSTARTEGSALGSWDPVGPGAEEGGRVYTTAVHVLCLEVYFRYASVLGAR